MNIQKKKRKNAFRYDHGKAFGVAAQKTVKSVFEFIEIRRGDLSGAEVETRGHEYGGNGIAREQYGNNLRRLQTVFLLASLLFASCKNNVTTQETTAFSIKNDTFYIHSSSENLMRKVKFSEVAEQAERLEIVTAGRIEAIRNQQHCPKGHGTRPSDIFLFHHYHYGLPAAFRLRARGKNCLS